MAGFTCVCVCVAMLSQRWVWLWGPCLVLTADVGLFQEPLACGAEAEGAQGRGDRPQAPSDEPGSAPASCLCVHLDCSLKGWCCMLLERLVHAT
eukprot:2895405-Rhodomonas_salina.1